MLLKGIKNIRAYPYTQREPVEMDAKLRRIRELTKQMEAMQKELDMLNGKVALQTTIVQCWSQRVASMPPCLCVPWDTMIEEREVSFGPKKALHITDEGRVWIHATTEELNKFGQAYCDFTANFCVIGVRHV